MATIKKAIFGGVALAVLSVGAFTTPAYAQDGASCGFTRNLTIGSTGFDVTCLQNVLISKGFSIPAGATGYFGEQTRSALAAYQSSLGIAPAAGYFGPITRTMISAVAQNPVPTPTPNPTPNPSNSGDEGELRKFNTINDSVEFEVKEKEKDVRVLGVEFDAHDSDMVVNRVDVEFERASGSGSNRLEQYVDSVSLWLGKKRIATESIDRNDRNRDNIYEIRFSGLNERVPEGDTSVLYVSVNTVNRIDSADQDTEWNVSIPFHGIRAVDEAGLSDTYGGSDLSEKFSFGKQELGGLKISSGDENPDEGIVIVDDKKETKKVELLSFELEARNQDIEVSDIPVSLAVSGNASKVNDILRTLKLMRGSKEIASKNVQNAGTYQEVVFDNLDLVIEEGENETFTVIADIRKLEGSFHEGDSVVASTTASMNGWDVEDVNGKDVDPTGSVTGGSQLFLKSGISVAFVSSRESVRTGSVAGDPDIADFTIVFDVTAIGDDDIYIDADIAPAGTLPVAGVDGLTWATTTDSTTGTASYSPTLSASGSTKRDTTSPGSANFFLREGETRRITFKVSIPAEDDNVNVGAMITGIFWGTDQGDDVMDNLYTFNLYNLKTDTVTGLFIH